MPLFNSIIHKKDSSMSMNLKNIKIGVWGFGIVGKSALTFLNNHEAIVEVLVDATMPDNDRATLAQKSIPLFGHADLHAFLERNTYIVPSPGINLLPHHAFAHKWLAELDLFAAQYPKPIIAVTGTVGKTSVTHLLSQLLAAYGTRALTGGNIGIGMLDLLAQDKDAEDNKSNMALLEVSSFQLELCKSFAPDLAIWTTFSENHLDRHGTMNAYFSAKYAIIKNQTASQQALLPLELIPYLRTQPKPASAISFFTHLQPTDEDFRLVDQYGVLYFTRSNKLIRYCAGQEQSLFDLATLPSITFAQNWLIIASALHLLKLPLEQLAQHAQTVSIPEHRLERVAAINGISFYNDSKSTTPPSTQAAIANFGSQPIHLFLGGLSKGIDRLPLIQSLGTNILHVYCFGAEADILHALCKDKGKTSSAHATMEDAFAHCIHQAQPCSIVLLSPSGSSYDLFVDYTHRGKRFKELVYNHQNKGSDARNTTATPF